MRGKTLVIVFMDGVVEHMPVVHDVKVGRDDMLRAYRRGYYGGSTMLGGWPVVNIRKYSYEDA